MDRVFVLGVLLLVGCEDRGGEDSSSTAAPSASPETASPAEEAPREPVKGSVSATDGRKITGEGSLAVGVAQRTVNAHVDAMTECYERELRKNAELLGRMTIRITIDETGSVSEARATENTMVNVDLPSCVVSIFRDMRFPAPEGGSVTYTFSVVFQPHG